MDELYTSYKWFAPVKNLLFLSLMLVLSLFVFKSKLKPLYKAIYMTAPLTVIFMNIGMFSYQLPIVTYSLGVLFFSCVLYYLFKTKKPWIYYYSLLFVSFVMLLVMLLGIEI
jgi:hypothetical protein